MVFDLCISLLRVKIIVGSGQRGSFSTLTLVQNRRRCKEGLVVSRASSEDPSIRRVRHVALHPLWEHTN